MKPAEFIAELDAENARALERIVDKSAGGEPADALRVDRLLLFALKNEIEATECAAAWIGSTPEVKVKLAFARQAGDEAKHYRLIQKRLAELGFDAESFDPFDHGRTPLLAYLLTLESTVARVAAGQFTREALALVRNDAFVKFCRTRGDEATAKLYEDVIQPDERHHHELGRTLLSELATTEAAQAEARAASRRVLEMAEELLEIARLKRGVTHMPGC